MRMDLERRLQRLEATDGSTVPLVLFTARNEVGRLTVGYLRQADDESEKQFQARAVAAIGKARRRPVVLMDAGDADL